MATDGGAYLLTWFDSSGATPDVGYLLTSNPDAPTASKKLGAKGDFAPDVGAPMVAVAWSAGHGGSGAFALSWVSKPEGQGTINLGWIAASGTSGAPVPAADSGNGALSGSAMAMAYSGGHYGIHPLVAHSKLYVATETGTTSALPLGPEDAWFTNQFRRDVAVDGEGNFVHIGAYNSGNVQSFAVISLPVPS